MRRLLTTFIFVASVALGAPCHADGHAARPADVNVDALAAVLANPDSDWEQREQAETALAALPAVQVLPALLAKLEPRPSGPSHPSADSPAADKDGPPQWLAYHSMRRALAVQLAKPDGSLGPLLADLMVTASASEMRLIIAQALRSDWSDRAETSLARLFRDASERSDVRAAAADALLRHLRDHYYNEVRAVAGGAGDSFKALLLPALMTSRSPAGRGIDPVVAVMGFEVLEQKGRLFNDPAAGFATAVELEAYLGVSFRPDPANPKYQPLREAGERFRRDTVDYSLTWWKANGPAIQAEAAKTRPGPT